MSIDKKTQPNIDNSDLLNYPNGRIRENDGSGNGTPLSRAIHSDIHEFFAKVMRLSGNTYNNLPDNESNGYQLIDSLLYLANKNNKLNQLSLISGTINLPIKLGVLTDNEILICKSNFNLNAETVIKGSDNVVLPFSFSPSDKKFKTGDYLRLIKNSGSIIINRLADAENIETLITELLFLKAATQSEEFSGSINNKATTPVNNLAAFTRRVIGTDSVNYLVSSIRNGLMSISDKNKLDNLESKVLNIGSFSSVDIETGPVGNSYTVTGDIVSAIVNQVSDNTSVIRVVISNSMSNTSYYVRSFLQSQSADIKSENTVGNIAFKPISATSFDIVMSEFVSKTQSIKLHLEVVKI